jgi:hypothetical protein
MNRNELNKIFEETVQECRDILFSKNMEYSKNENSLENFDSGAKIAEISVLKVWYIYFHKHLNSLETYIREGEVFSNESIEGRIYDIINYLIILRALIDRVKKEENKSSIEKDKILLEN